MISLDTNLLVYAHRAESPFHRQAREQLRTASEGTEPWAIAWPCVHEFLAIVTNPRVFDPPTSLDAALAEVEGWMGSPKLVLLAEDSEGYWPILSRVLRAGKIQGAKVHDARVAALCLLHSVDELLSADRDFSRFPSLKCRNPL